MEECALNKAFVRVCMCVHVCVHVCVRVLKALKLLFSVHQCGKEENTRCEMGQRK